MGCGRAHLNSHPEEEMLAGPSWGTQAGRLGRDGEIPVVGGEGPSHVLCPFVTPIGSNANMTAPSRAPLAGHVDVAKMKFRQNYASANRRFHLE